MPIAKRPVKKARSQTNKCPWCGSRSFEKASRLSLLEKIRYIGCTTWLCGKCSKKWAN